MLEIRRLSRSRPHFSAIPSRAAGSRSGKVARILSLSLSLLLFLFSLLSQVPVMTAPHSGFRHVQRRKGFAHCGYG